MSTARPLILVVCIDSGFGMLPAFWPLRYSARLIRSAVASAIGSHSSTTLVCVALRHRRMGAAGSAAPKEARIWSWSCLKARSAAASEFLLRVTLMSTMDPEAMSGGRRIEGNSI